MSKSEQKRIAAMQAVRRMTAHAIGAALDFGELDAEDLFVDAAAFDALAAALREIVDGTYADDTGRERAMRALGIASDRRDDRG